jgi:predicted unusual protein kinase regulating ubiquinone biosynthesis (AarF/ABC1/UbiB family)
MRTLTILHELLPLTLSLIRDQRRWLYFGGPVTRTAAFHQRRAERMVAALGRLGPTFVKMGQVFAGRNDLLAEPYAKAFATLTDRVPPVPFAAVERVILENYGRGYAELFEQFDPEPIAAASLGQVHRARYQGREVAVKVLRPGVAELVDQDIVSARRILRVATRWFDHPHLRGLRTAVEEFALRIHEEMDFRLEGANAMEIGRRFAGTRGVRIPGIEEEMIREQVLVLEYCEGTRVDELDDLVASGRIQPDTIVRRVLDLYIRMMLMDGLFHADPHPGNLLLAPDGALVLVDFGMVVKVSRARRRQILDTALASIRRDPEGVVDGFFALGMVEPGTDRARIRPLADAMLALADQRTTTMERIEYLSQQLMSALYDWPIVLPGDLVYFARTAALIEGLGVRYDAHFNPLLVATPILLELRPLILAALNDGGAPRARDWTRELGEFLTRAGGILRRAGEELKVLVGEALFLGVKSD